VALSAFISSLREVRNWRKGVGSETGRCYIMQCTCDAREEWEELDFEGEELGFG